MEHLNPRTLAGWAIVRSQVQAQWANVFYVLWTAETYIGNRGRVRVSDELRVTELDFRSREDRSKKIAPPAWVWEGKLALTDGGDELYELEWAGSFWRINERDGQGERMA